MWILKPSGLSRGRGITMFDNLKEIQTFFRNKDTPWICMKYIENPWIVSKRKVCGFCCVLMSFSSLILGSGFSWQIGIRWPSGFMKTAMWDSQPRTGTTRTSKASLSICAITQSGSTPSHLIKIGLKETCGTQSNLLNTAWRIMGKICSMIN